MSKSDKRKPLGRCVDYGSTMSVDFYLSEMRKQTDKYLNDYLDGAFEKLRNNLFAAIKESG